MADIRIEPLQPSAPVARALANLLIETVASGGSVGFMHPLAAEEAEAFWAASLAHAAAGRRIVLGACAGDVLAASVTLQLDLPPNQPHRAEIAKMMTLPAFRGKGIASALLREAERLAALAGRTLLVLDTAADEGAAGFYLRMGYTLAGAIPEFALKPHGGLTDTIIFWKRLEAKPRQ